MASSVVSDNFETGSGGVPQLGGTGATTCKAWVNFNGTGTVAIRDSYNVSSITDNGTGEYTVNFSTSMPNANYSVSSMSSSTTGSSVGFMCLYTWAGSAPTTSSFRVATAGNGSNIQEDCAFPNVQVFGN